MSQNLIAANEFGNLRLPSLLEVPLQKLIGGRFEILDGDRRQIAYSSNS
jgi:hypothetical protein